MSIGNQTITWQDVVRLWGRHRWHFLVPMFITAMLVLGAAQFLPRTYQASAIFERRNDLVMSEIIDRGAPHSFETLKRSLAEELRGLPAIEQVIDDLALAPAPPADAPPVLRRQQTTARQKLIEHIRTHLRVYFDISTNEVDRIRVVLTDTDPDRAPRIVNQLVRNYIDHTRRQIDKMLTEAAGFFQTQADQARRQIQQLEEQRLDFEIRHAGLLPDTNTSITDTLAQAEQQLDLLERKRQVADNRIARLRAELDQLGAEQPQSVIKGINPDYSRLEMRLAEYRDKLEHARIIEKMTDRHPTVVALKKKIAQIQTELKNTPREIVTQRIFATNHDKRTELELALAEATSQQETLDSECQALRKQVAQLRARSAQFFPVRSAYRQIVRQIEDTQRQLSFWEDNHRRVTLALQAELGRRGMALEFIRPSGPIRHPTSPDPMQVVFAALGLGLLAGIGWLVLAERSDQSLHDLEQANAAIGVPVLGSVAQIVTRRQALWQRMCRRWVHPAVMAGMLAALGAAAWFNYRWLQQPVPPALHRLLGIQEPAGPNAPAPQARSEPARPDPPVKVSSLAPASTDRPS